jgi:3-oxoacyl-[acyl-carrier protein] reductase
MPFAGKSILVTASTRGIGRAIAKSLHAAGATVGINGRSEEAVLLTCDEIGKERTIPVAADLSLPDAGGELVKRFAAKADGLHGLVNNAGHGHAAPFRAMTTETWQSTFALNLESAMTASREAYNIMRKAQSGSIVNIASISGHGPGKWMGADYAASKAALVSMTKSFAFEAGRFNIRANAVSPGFVDTDMTQAITQEMRDGIGIPMKRFAKPEEVASAVMWLLSNDSQYITGQVLHVDGGLHM